MRNRGLMTSLALLLAACDGISGPNAAICAPPAGPPASPRSVTPEQREVTGDCIWFWSYRLAHAEGSIEDVADAVIGACAATIERLETLSARDSNREPDIERATLPFRRDAMYRIAEARAGRCEAP